jgi:site-specific recombinase XerC
MDLSHSKVKPAFSSNSLGGTRGFLAGGKAHQSLPSSFPISTLATNFLSSTRRASMSSPVNSSRIWVRGKNGSHRVVYLSAQTLDALQDWLAVRPSVEDQAVFLSRPKKRLTTTAIRMRIIHYRRLAGVEVSCHQLRHCFGRHMVEEHVPLGVIRELMGHRWLRTTLLYTRISDQQVQANYDAAAKEIGRRLSLEGEGQ